MNSVVLIGNVANDVELRKTSTNKSVVDFALAVNEFVGGEQKADFIDCQCWEKSAELLTTYCSKGSKIAVSGKIKTNSFETKDGKKVKKTFVLVDRIEFLSQKVADNKKEEPSSPKVIIDQENLPFY